MNNQSHIILIYHIPNAFTHFINSHTKCNRSYNHMTLILNPAIQCFFLLFILNHNHILFIQGVNHDTLLRQNHLQGGYPG